STLICKNTASLSLLSFLHVSHLFFSFSFFFSSSDDHRDLHSFPTRRSSDLLSMQSPRGAIADVRCDAQEHPERKSPAIQKAHGFTSIGVLGPRRPGVFIFLQGSGLALSIFVRAWSNFRFATFLLRA